MKLRRPVMADDEAEAALVVMRAVLHKNVLVEHDADKLRGAIESIECAPGEVGDPVERDPGAKALGKFARQSVTSRKAALQNYPKSGSQRERILRHVLENGAHGATRQQVGAACHLPPNVATPRCLELLEGGWLKVKTDDDGNIVTRKTTSGADANVLVATEKAVKRAEQERAGLFSGAVA